MPMRPSVQAHSATTVAPDEHSASSAASGGSQRTSTADSRAVSTANPGARPGATRCGNYTAKQLTEQFERRHHTMNMFLRQSRQRQQKHCEPY